MIPKFTNLELELLHKVTTWTYKPTVSGLIKIKDYELCNDYMKGYIHYLQSSWEESQIHNNEEIDSDEFRAGLKQAMMEMVDLDS